MSWIEHLNITDNNSSDKPAIKPYEFNWVAENITNIKLQEATQYETISDAKLEKLLNWNLDTLDVQHDLRSSNDVSIENNYQSLNNFTQVRTLLSQNLTWKFSKLDSILAKGEALLNSSEPLPDLELSELLAEITTEAVDYLKHPQNREILVAISRELEHSNLAQFKEFQNFLISQDTEFKTIFENLSYPLNANEMTIVAALPDAPKGRMSEGFSANLDSETLVNVIQDGGNISRRLMLWNATLPTEILEVDMAKTQTSFEQEIQSLGTEQSGLARIQTLVEQHDGADISDLIKKFPAEFEAFDLNTITDKQALLSRVHVKLADIKDTINRVEKEYRKAISDAVRSTRELYKTIDRKAKQTLLRLRNLGLDKWNLEALIREMVAGQLMPDLGVAFSADNLDLANQNFWESESLTDTFDVFNDNLTRFANKGLTGNPEGLDENGNLIGFSLVTARLNPNAQTKTGGELIHLMESQGIMDEGVFNLNKVKDNLRKPIEA